MNISTDVLYDLLSQKYSLDRFGKGTAATSVMLPVFYEPGSAMERGRTYIARTQNLPTRPPERCLVVCLGPKPSKAWNAWAGEMIYVADAHDDILGVFNAVQRILNRIIAWGIQMQELAASGTHIEEMVEASIPIFQNRITVTDYDMNVLAHCELDEDGGPRMIAMSNLYDHVPAEKMALFPQRFAYYARNREPFFVEEEGRGDNYCINLHLGDSYIGCCTLQEDLRPLRTSDLELFQLFAGFVRQALAIQAQSPHGQLVTLKSVIGQLLNLFPVSSVDMRRSLEHTALNLGGADLAEYWWCCVAIQSANRGRDLPEGYLCRTVEGVLPNAAAVVYEDSIVAYCLVKRTDDVVEEICDPLDAYLKDMNFRAGISRTFGDLFQARDYYQQAMCALDTGYAEDPARSWYLFDDFALSYMLRNCCGEFKPELIVAPELVQLRGLSTKGVDYIETLRAFLDNDCNASRTAKAMFLHRSTLVQRLERLREVVDFEDADRCLYLRMCLHLPDVNWDA